MRIIDLQTHFYTVEYLKYLRSRKETPFEAFLDTCYTASSWS